MGFVRLQCDAIGLTNVIIIFLIVVIHSHNILEVFLVHWTIYNLSLIKDHAMKLRLMLDRFQQMQLLLNIKKFILCAMFSLFLGYIVSKKGVLVDQAKILVIVKFLVP